MLTRPLYLLLRLILPVAVTGLALLVGLAYVLSQPVLYQSKAKVWIQAMDPHQLSETLYQPLSRFFNNPIITSCELMKSEAVVSKARALLRKRSPEYQDFSTAKLKAEGVKFTDIVTLSYVDTNPRKAAAIVGAVLDAFVSDYCDQGSEVMARKLDTLRGQLAQAQQEFFSARHRLAEFKSKAGTLNVNQTASHTLGAVRDFDVSMNDTRVNLARTQSVIEMLQSQLDGRSGSVARVRAVSHDGLVQALKEKLAQDEVKAIEMRSKLQPDHVRLRRMEASIAKSKEALAARIDQIFNSKGEQEETSADEATSGLMTEIAKAKAQLAAEKLSYQYQQAAVDEKRQLIKSLPAQEEQLLELERSASYYSGLINELQLKLQNMERSGATMRSSNVQIVEYPHVPTLPQANRMTQMLLPLVIAVLLGGAVFAFMLFIDPAVDNTNLLRRLFNAPLFAGFNRLSQLDGLPGELRAAQLIRFGIRPWINSRRKRIVVTSSDKEDGKTVIAAALALAYARSGQKVALLDANLAEPSLHRLFKINQTNGWYQCILQKSPIEEAAISPEPNLDVFPARPLANSSGLLESKEFEEFVRQLDSRYDILIFDTPSVLHSAESLAMLGKNCCVLFVVRFRHTLKKSVRLFAAGLKHIDPACKLAVVLNDIDEQSLAADLVTAEETEPDSAPASVI